MRTAMNKWPLGNTTAMNAFYGNPDPDGDGIPNRAWEAENLVRVVPPYPMVLAWAVDKPLKSFWFHKKAAPALMRVLKQIDKAYEPLALKTYGLQFWGGTYSFRVMRGGSNLSMHSWGAAIDLSPLWNPFGKRYTGERSKMMPMDVVHMFEVEGFKWGGEWKKPDCMHFQAAR